MKLRKIVSGILACAMILSSVPASADEISSERGQSEQQGPHLSYVTPREGGVPLPVRVSAGTEHYTEFADRAQDPVNLVSVYPNGEASKIENMDGIWGFSGQVKSEASDDKFDVTGNTPMIIAFKLYVKKPGAGSNGQVIVSKGDCQYCISLIGNGLRFHSSLTGTSWNNYSFNNCFPKMNQWYDVVFVKDGDEGIRFYVDDQAGSLMGYRSLAHFDDAFSIGTMMQNGSGTRDFTSDYGYVADVKFYNGAAMEGSEKEAFEKAVDLRAWDALENKGVIPLYQLLESTLPTADFSLRPYRTVTEWSESQTGSKFTGSFKCGTEYTATTTLTVRDGETFRFTESMAETVKSDIENASYYSQIPAEKLTGKADSQEKSGENGAEENAVDGNSSTIWHSNYTGADSDKVNLNSDPKVNNTYTITLENTENIDKFEYVPRSEGGTNGIITKANLYYSTTENEDDFQLVAENLEWAGDTDVKEVFFDETLKNVKRIRIVVDAAMGGFITAAEFCLYEKIDVQVSGSEASILSDGKQMTVKTDYKAEEVPCTHSATTVAIGNVVDLEEGRTRQLEPIVTMDDGTLMSSHKGFAAETISYQYVSANEDVATVSGTGLLTAVGKGQTTITVTAAIPGQETNPARTIYVEVFEKGKMFLHPEMIYKKPEAGKYPEVAEVELNREQEDAYPGLITDVVGDEARLVRVNEDEEVAVTKLDGLIGFNGQYKSTHTDNKFNVTGNKPLVMMFKLWVEKLPETGEEWAIVTKGNQFSFALKNDSDTDNVPKLRLGMMGINGDWPIAAYTIPDNWTGKWHDVVIVFDGKGTKDSMGFFVDGEFVTDTSDKIGTIGNKDYLNGETDTLRAFTICGKDGEDQVFTKECGYLAGFKFFDVTEVASDLVDEINLSELGNENGAAIIKYMLDAKDRTAHITATPYKMQTTWSVTGEDTVLAEKVPFTAENIRDKGYTATTVLTTYGDFVFDEGEVAHIQEELRHIYVEPEIDSTLIQQSATISDDNKVLTVKVSFLPRKAQAPSITYTSPIPGGTPRRQPISNDANAQYTMSNSVWSVVGGAVMGEEDTFAAITETNKYQVRTVLTAKGDYLFDTSAAYIAEAKANIETQRFGNVDAEKTVEVAPDGKTMTITVVYSKSIYTVTFELNGATTPAVEEMQSVSTGNLMKKPVDPEKTGSEFVCWYEKEDETQAPYDFTKPITKNVSLVAKWARYLNITLDDGTGKPSKIVTVLEGGKLTKPADPQNGTKEFLGWYLKSDENYTAYDFDDPVTEEITLYGQWKDDENPTPVQVKFMDGETELASKEVNIGEKVTMPDEPSKTGYIFDGWFIDPDCTRAFNPETRIVSNTVLYAKWMREVVAVTGIALDPEEFELEIGGTKKLTVNVKPEGADDAEVTFSSDNENIASVDETGTVTAHTVGTTKIKATLTTDSDITAEAVVTVKEQSGGKTTYTVTFNSNGGTAVDAQTVEAGNRAEVPRKPQRPEYAFAGWYTDEALLNAYDFNAPVTGNITLYAKWNLDAPSPSLKIGETGVVEEIEYKVIDVNAKTVEISKGMVSKKKKVVIPETIEINGVKCTVVGIAKNAFKGNKKMRQITIPATVTSIGNKAFLNCKNLKKVIVQGKILKPGKASFKNTSAKLKIKANKMTKKQRAALQKTIRSKGKNKKAKVTK